VRKQGKVESAGPQSTSSKLVYRAPVGCEEWFACGRESQRGREDSVLSVREQREVIRAMLRVSLLEALR
jgi:hypothetical protein